MKCLQRLLYQSFYLVGSFCHLRPLSFLFGPFTVKGSKTKLVPSQHLIVVAADSKNPTTMPGPRKKLNRIRCGTCEQCSNTDCGLCKHCVRKVSNDKRLNRKMPQSKNRVPNDTTNRLYHVDAAKKSTAMHRSSLVAMVLGKKRALSVVAEI
jgi:hypothetical protein